MTKILIDTGADKSMISRAMYNALCEIEATHPIVTRPAKATVSAELGGYCEVSFSIDTVMKHKGFTQSLSDVLVVDGLGHDFILGMDAMSSRVMVDVRNGAGVVAFAIDFSTIVAKKSSLMLMLLLLLLLPSLLSSSSMVMRLVVWLLLLVLIAVAALVKVNIDVNVLLLLLLRS